MKAAGDLFFVCVYAAKGKGSGGVKTAKLYAWVALQTLPEEMVISPCLLDFLEKALETIPITPVERNYTGVFYASQIPASYSSIFSLVVRTKCLCCLLLSIGFPRGRHGSVWCRTAGGIRHLSGVLLNISLFFLSRGCGRLCQSSGLHHSSIFKPRGNNSWIVNLVGQVSGSVCFCFFFFSLSPLRSASAACQCPGWSVCSSFPLWT